MDALRDPENGTISPTRLAAHLHLSMEGLADLTQLRVGVLLSSAASPRVQARLRPIVTVLMRASRLVDDDEGLVVYWFRNELLAGFDGIRAIDLVKAGRQDAVLAFLDMVENGVPA